VPVAVCQNTGLEGRSVAAAANTKAVARNF